MLPDPSSPAVPVVRVYSQLGVGGIERQLLQILPLLEARGRYRTALLLTRHAGALLPEMQRTGLTAEVVPLRGGLAWRAVSTLAARLKAHRAALVHAHAYEANTTATAAALLAGRLPVVATIHSTGTIRGLRRRLQDRLLNTLRDAVVCVSEEVRRNYLEEVGGSPDKVVVIYNGCDVEGIRATPADPTGLRREFGFPPDALVTVCVGRLVALKGHAHLLDAFARIASGRPRARLLIVGDGPERAAIEGRCREPDLRGRVALAGTRADVARLLRSCDVGTLASGKEGFSNVVLESLAAGLPLVVTDVGGNREAMDGERSGLLVPPRDPEALARALDRLCADDSFRRDKARGAAARASRFALERTADDFEALYDNLMAHRTPRS